MFWSSMSGSGLQASSRAGALSSGFWSGSGIGGLGLTGEAGHTPPQAVCVSISEETLEFVDDKTDPKTKEDTDETKDHQTKDDDQRRRG